MIGLITINDFGNLGNRLQNYAMYKMLSEFDVVRNIVRTYGCMGEMDGVTPRKRNPLKVFARKLFRYPYRLLKRLKKDRKYLIALERSECFANFNRLIKNGETLSPKTDFKKLSEKYNYFVTGSDQVWNPTFLGNGMFVNMLGFAPSEKKIAGCPSISIDFLTEEQESEFKGYLSDFRALSCRERMGAELIARITGKKCETLIDPTLAMDMVEWEVVSKKPRFYDGNAEYALLYFLGGLTDEYRAYVNEITKRHGLTVIDISNRETNFFACGPSEFIWMVKHSSLVLTDSFHALSFAIIFDRPIKVFNRADKGSAMNSRMISLAEALDLDRSVFFSDNPCLPDHLMLCYNKGLLSNEKKKFHDYFKNALG